MLYPKKMSMLLDWKDGSKEVAMNNNLLRLSIFKIMMYLNWAMVIFLSYNMYVSLNKISTSMHAAEFLQSVSYLPPAPWIIPVFAMGAYAVMLFLIDIQSIVKIHQYIFNIVQIVMGIVVIAALQMNYNGIILLVAAHLLGNYKGNKNKLVFLAGSGTLLLIFDFHLCSQFLHITSFETCIQYYRSVYVSILLMIKNIGYSLNIILFIVYAISLLREQIDENEKVQELNNQLNSANEELQRANKELENYAKDSERMAQTKERNRLAREIHDTLGHTLIGIISGIDAALTILPISTEKTKEHLEVIREVARRGITDVRRSVNALRPDALDRADLLSAIQETIEQMSTASNVKINFTNDAGRLKFSEDEEDIIYRIIQECITNAIRHGKATIVDIYLQRQYSVLTIRIKDNGIGVKELKYGFGFTHMEERLEMINGSLYTESEDGFLVVAKIPIRWGEEND